ncbi:uncharacterized protein [Coffea arabica]|uniref:Uncharacterized protein isoform X2 n=1 Tax=Coffea arabica TaxID=13443 RepID=A0ABM4X446_COFAR
MMNLNHSRLIVLTSRFNHFTNSQPLCSFLRSILERNPCCGLLLVQHNSPAFQEKSASKFSVQSSALSMSNHHPSRMAVDAALGGSSLTFAYAVLKDLWVYMKHRRKHVKDLLDNLKYLGDEAGILYARWHDNEEDIDRRAASIQRSRQHEAWKKVVSQLLDDYSKIIAKYRKMTGATGNQRRQEAEGSNKADVDESSTNAPIHELPDISHLGKHKLWTRKFFKLARLDKDVMKLRDKFASARKDIPLANLTRPVKPKAAIRMEDAKDLDVAPSHQNKLDELLRELLPCGVEAEAEPEAEAEAEAKAKLKRIAICGEAQVGKTNIMKNLNNWFDSCPPSAKLDYVIWVTVPTNLHEKEDVIKTIQESILRRLELTEQISAIDKNKDTICTELREKSYLLLFEGFSSSIQLGKIGVSEEHKHVIVVIETTYPVLLRSFGFDQKIKVEKLPHNDSRKLFDKIMEDEKLSKECYDLVGLIPKELSGLPGVISFIAMLLKSKMDAEFWGTIKDKLTADVGESEDLGLGGLFKAFEIAYEGLKEDRCKSCLLYAALFPKEFTIPINVLVECWKAKDFLCCPIPTFLKARGDGIYVLHKLTELSLLENCSEQYVKMPILFRRFAIRTSFPGEEVGTSYVRSGPEIDGNLTDEEWEKARRVSLIGSRLEKLPVSPICEGISTLFLQHNPNLRIIGETFFTSMKKLRVLDLHSTGIQLLPPSISSLTALRSLYLNNCDGLTKLPPKIVKLTKLEVLDIRDTSIHFLPKEVSSLVGLRCLRFSFAPPKPRLWERIVRCPNYSTTGRRVIFPPGAADQLSKLEEMTIVLVNGSSDCIVDQIEAEVLEFKNKNNQFKLILHKPSQSLDQRNLVQLRGEGTTLPNQSVPASHVHDPTTGNQSPRSDNEIFVPINEDNQHWYCIQVDFVKKKVYILDSLPNSTKQRGVMVRKLVQVLDTVLQHKFGDKYKFQASSFEFDESPNIPKQSNRMAVDAALGGSSLTFAYAVLKDLWVYMKHRRKHVKDLLDNLKYLGDEAGILYARWHDNEEDIDRRAASIQRSRQHEAWKKVVSRLLDDYSKIIAKYRKMTGATGNQRRQEAEGSNKADVDESSTNAPIHELPDISHLGKHKLWTRKFFKLARLDKDVMKLRDKFASARKDIPLANLTRPVKPKAAIRMEDAKDLDVAPSHQNKLDELLRELLPCGVEAEAEPEAEAEAEAKAKLKRIAICGEAQVGKTNIMKNLNNWFDSCPPSAKLDYVIWVTVPTNLHEKEDVIKTIQESILRRLELTEQISAIDKNKDTICTELREKSYLLLFEGFSSSIQLGKIGVSEEHKHVIVVIETTYPVLLRSFGFDQKIKVEKLPHNDSRKLFDKIMEDEKLSKECYDLVGLIPKELSGLPGVISFIAMLLKSKIDAEFWGTIKDKLTADVGESEDLGLGGLFKAFEIAYEGLKEDRCKSCLLYAALFPKEFTIPINVLVECWKAKDFLCCPIPTFLKARGDGIYVLHKLTELSLLENCSEQYVKMPILFRRFAIRTSFPGEEVGTSYVRSGPEIDGNLTDEEWEKARRVSLIGSRLEKLPVSPICEGISTLFLQHNPNLRIIGETFFTSMKKLRVLDLHSTGIQLLPPSISSLTALRSLYLNNCDGLTKLPPKIVKLTKLEVLDIRDTSIHFLPKEVSSLVGLRCLRFSFAPPKPRLWERIVRCPNYSTTGRRVIFPPGAADQLSKLEEMTIVLVNGSSDCIVDQIEAEVLEFKNKNNQFKLILHKPSQSLDQRNLVQLRGEGTTLPNQSVPASHVHDPTTGNQSPRSDNEIFVPINEDNQHWYCTQVDFVKKKVYILDS